MEKKVIKKLKFDIMAKRNIDNTGYIDMLFKKQKKMIEKINEIIDEINKGKF